MLLLNSGLYVGSSLTDLPDHSGSDDRKPSSTRLDCHIHQPVPCWHKSKTTQLRFKQCSSNPIQPCKLTEAKVRISSAAFTAMRLSLFPFRVEVRRCFQSLRRKVMPSFDGKNPGASRRNPRLIGIIEATLI